MRPTIALRKSPTPRRRPTERSRGSTNPKTLSTPRCATPKPRSGAAEAEIGNAFIPVMTELAKDAKWVGDEMAKHPGIAHGVVTALEVLGGAWLGFKALNIAETILTPIARGLGGIIAGEEGAAAGAGRLKGALGGLGAVGVGLAAGDIIDSTAADQAKKHPDNPFWKGANQFLHFPGSGFGAINWRGEHLAHGGPIHGPGPKGRDSVPMWWRARRARSHRIADVRCDGRPRERLRLPPARCTASTAARSARTCRLRSRWWAITYSQEIALGLLSGCVGRVILGAMGMPAQWPADHPEHGPVAGPRSGFRPGIGGPGQRSSVGWYNHGSGTQRRPRRDDPVGRGERRIRGQSRQLHWSVRARPGPTSSQFDHHMFLPTLFGEGAGGGMPGMGGMGGGFGGGGGGLRWRAGQAVWLLHGRIQGKIQAANDRYHGVRQEKSGHGQRA